MVATQCLEVGADLDFDYMISEAASLDALRQRFGRLNRGGREINCGGEIVIRADQKRTQTQLDRIKHPREVDPVYGTSLPNTFRWLESIANDGIVDFGSATMDHHWNQLTANENEKPAFRDDQLLIDQPEQTTLLPAHLDLLSQTYVHFAERSPSHFAGPPEYERITVFPDPDVGIFLHGMEQRSVDVQVCWRADLSDLRQDDDGKKSLSAIKLDARISTVSEAPPTSSECMTISLPAIKNFLTGNETCDDQADQAPFEEDQADGDIPPWRQPVLWRGADDSIVCRNSREIRPGDTLVLPLSTGGWSLLGHIPNARIDPAVDPIDGSDSEVIRGLVDIDIADQAYLMATWKERVRIYPLLKNAGIDTTAIQNDPRGDNPKDLSSEEVGEALRLLSNRFDGILSHLLAEFAQAPKQVGYTHRSSGSGVMFSGKQGRLDRSVLDKYLVGREPESQPISEFQDVSSSSSDSAILLTEHLRRVASRAAAIAAAVGLPDNLVEQFNQAGMLHDLGKADARFQSLLFGGSPNEAWLRPNMLAKSKRAAQTHADRRRDFAHSELPRNFRHELLSLQLVEQAGWHSSDLVLHLVASHHGHARPWMPPCIDDDAPDVDLRMLGIDYVLHDRNESIDTRARTGIAERFWRVQRYHGVWGTALLESVLRIADQQISHEESEGTQDQISSEPLKLSFNERTLHMSETLLLGGIDGANPLAMLAALGVFRAIEEARPSHHVRLHWIVESGSWRPVLTSDDLLNEQTVVDLVFDGRNPDIMAGLNRFDEFDEFDDVTKDRAGKLTPSSVKFHRAARSILAEYLSRSVETHLYCDCAAALGNECTQKRFSKEREIEHSELYMTKGSGHQRMLDLARVIREQTTPNDVRRALFESWVYDDLGRGRSLRWDPADDRPYARRWKSPSSDPVMTVLGANYLAIEAFPFFPTAVVNRHLETTGFRRIRRLGTFLSWPIWNVPLDVPTVRGLLQLGDIHNKDPNDIRLAQHGVMVVKRVERVRNDKYFNFSAAESV